MKKTNLQLIKGLRSFEPKTPGQLTQSEIATIANALELRNMNEIELQNMRDFLYALFSDQITVAQANNETVMLGRYKNMLASLSFVIDLHLRAAKERDMTEPEPIKGHEHTSEILQTNSRSVMNLKQSVKRQTTYDR